MRFVLVRAFIAQGLFFALHTVSAGAPENPPTNSITAPGPRVTFKDVSVQSGFRVRNASWSMAWADYDGDGNLDVFTVGHVHSICQLWHNNGDGTFSDVTSRAGLLKEDGDAHGCAWGDFDADGLVDLYVSKGTVSDLTINYNDL